MCEMQKGVTVGTHFVWIAFYLHNEIASRNETPTATKVR